MAIDILAIGAHMGDEIAWGYALAAQVRQGLKVGLLHLTPGEKGHATLSPDEYAAQKRKEAKACADALGVEIWTLDFRDGELIADEELKWAVSDVLRESRPRLVITHWKGSMHKDHTICHEIIPDARFYAGLPAFKRELPHHWVSQVLYGENWEDLRGFEPEIYAEVLEEDLKRYETAMREYALFRGEVAKFPYLDYYKALARTRGCEVGCDFAATFAVPPESRRKKLTRLLD